MFAEGAEDLEGQVPKLECEQEVAGGSDPLVGVLLGSRDLRSLLGKMNRVPSSKAGTKQNQSGGIGSLHRASAASLARVSNTLESLARLNTRSTLAEFSIVTLVRR